MRVFPGLSDIYGNDMFPTSIVFPLCGARKKKRKEVRFLGCVELFCIFIYRKIERGEASGS